jgi:hypothetical protein
VAKLRALKGIHRCCCWTCPLFDRRLRRRIRAKSSLIDGRFDDLHVEGAEGCLRFPTKTSPNEYEDHRGGSPKNVSSKYAYDLVREL